MELHENTWNVLAQVSMLTAREASAVSQAEKPEMRSWLLEQVAIQREQRVRLRYSFLTMLFHPTFLCVVGLLVAWICVGFFSVLVAMISSLA